MTTSKKIWKADCVESTAVHANPKSHNKLEALASSQHETVIPVVAANTTNLKKSPRKTKKTPSKEKSKKDNDTTLPKTMGGIFGHDGTFDEPVIADDLPDTVKADNAVRRFASTLIDGLRVFEHPNFRNCSLEFSFKTSTITVSQLIYKAFVVALKRIILCSRIDPNSEDTDLAWSYYWFLCRVIIRKDIFTRDNKSKTKSFTISSRLRNFINNTYFEEMLNEMELQFPMSCEAAQEYKPKLISGKATNTSVQQPQSPATEAMLDDSELLRTHTKEFKKQDINEFQENRCGNLMRKGLTGKAAQAIGNSIPISWSHAIEEQIKPLYPPARTADLLAAFLERESGSLESCTVSLDTLLKAGKKMKRGSAAGPDNISPDILTYPLRAFTGTVEELEEELDEPSPNPCIEYIGILLEFINDVIAPGRIHQSHRNAFSSSAGFVLQKPEGGLRPIGCGSAMRRLAMKCITLEMMPNIQRILGVNQFAVGYPHGLETCKFGIEESLKASPGKDLLWIDYTNAFNAIDRVLLMDAIILWFPRLIPVFNAFYGTPTDISFITKDEQGKTLPGRLSSAQGVTQGCPLSGVLFSIGTHLTSLLEREALGYTIDPGVEMFAQSAIKSNQWNRIVKRFRSNATLQARISEILASSKEISRFNSSPLVAIPPAIETPAVVVPVSVMPEHGVVMSNHVISAAPVDPGQTTNENDEFISSNGVVPRNVLDPTLAPVDRQSTTVLSQNPQITEAKYMDDQWVMAPLGCLLLNYQIRKAIAEGFAGLLFNINPLKQKTGLFLQIPCSPDLLDELKLIFTGTIITPSTEEDQRGLTILGSPLRQSSQFFKDNFLTNMFLKALNGGAANFLKLKSSHYAWKILQQCFAQKFNHIFRTLPAEDTKQFATRLENMLAVMYDVVHGGAITPARTEDDCITNSRHDQLFEPCLLGGRGLPNPRILQHAAYLGCTWSILSHGSSEFRRSFPGLSFLLTTPFLGGVDSDTKRIRSDIGAVLMASVKFLRKLPIHESTVEYPEATDPVAQQNLNSLLGENDEPICFKKLPFEHRIKVGGESRTVRDSSMSQTGLTTYAAKCLWEATQSGLCAEASTQMKPSESKNASDVRQRRAAFRHQLRFHQANSGHALFVQALPLGPQFHLSNEELLLASEMSLGDNISMLQRVGFCKKCNRRSDGGWHTLLACRQSGHGIPPHNAIVDVVMHYFQKYTGVAVSEVTTGFSNAVDNRRGDIRIDDGTAGIGYIFDVSIINPLANSHQLTAKNRSVPLAAASQRENQKIAKHEEACRKNQITFLPYVVETTGGFGKSTRVVEDLLLEYYSRFPKDHTDPEELIRSRFRKDVTFALRKGSFATARSVALNVQRSLTRFSRSHGIQASHADHIARQVFADYPSPLS